MTDLSRGARVRRGGRRPGWVLLTALLVLAIGASSALVFTNRVELLKLAVILALWAAVVAAFVSVIYRRQSDVDQARARDLKLVYDLQLDREISARREYELTVESQLRRELASELRAQSADEVSALRAELAALRTNLEILFDAELSERPALETERRTVRGYSDWDREHESARERVNRVTSVRAEEPRRVDDSSIIDVPEEPLTPPPRQPVADNYRAAEYAYRAARAGRDDSTPPTGWAAAGPSTTAGADRQPEGRGWAQPEPEPTRGSHWRPEPPPQPEPRFAPPPAPPEPPLEQQRPEWSAPAPPPRREEAPAGWPGAGTSGNSWNAEPADNSGVGPWKYDNAPSRDTNLGEPTSQPVDERRGRHSSADELGRPARSRHSADNSAYSDADIGSFVAPPPAMSPPPPPPMPPAPPSPGDREPAMSPPPSPGARHRSSDALDTDAPPSGGQSVAELLARLQTTPSSGGRRRRRED
jgi:hypothetical protein